MPVPPTNLRQFQSLVEIVSSLRGPDGCPWDKEQTHETLTQYAIEEVFELVEAIESGDDALIKDELGDNLFQVVLHSVLATQRGAFTMEDCIQNISEKLIRRHPHVFSDTKVTGTEEVIANWEAIKKLEKKQLKTSDPLQVPSGLPALQRAFKIGKRTEKFQFDWKQPDEVLEKVHEEFAELQEALDSEKIEAIEHEIGDMLFSLAQLARHLDLEPEQVLRKANRRFEARFAEMFALCEAQKKDFTKLNSEEKESLWKEAKNKLG